MNIDFNLLAIVLTVIGSIAGIVIPLHISMKNSMDDFHKRIEEINIRMAKQDADFKAFMKQEEEKRTRIIMERK